jgi:hypothetical protein
MMETMKTAIACALALGLAGAGVQADGLDCCRNGGEKTAACCAGGDAGQKICLQIKDVTAAVAAERLSKAIGAEVRLQGQSFGMISLKICAASPQAALAQAATAIHARWRPAYIFGAGSVNDKPMAGEPSLSVVFRNAPAASAAYVAAARAGAVLIADKPLTGKVNFSGKGVPVGTVLDVIATAAGVNWKPAYVIQMGSEIVSRRPTNLKRGPNNLLKPRPDSPLTHLHRTPGGVEGVAPAPGMIVKDPQAESARLEQEAIRRAQLGEWAGVFTLDSPKEIRRAIRDLRIRVETAIQKLESYPPQNRHLGAAMWHARYLRMIEDLKSLTPEQQKQVQPVLEAMKYFAEDPEKTN